MERKERTRETRTNDRWTGISLVVLGSVGIVLVSAYEPAGEQLGIEGIVAGVLLQLAGLFVLFDPLRTVLDRWTGVPWILLGSGMIGIVLVLDPVRPSTTVSGIVIGVGVILYGLFAISRL